jgi:3-oxoacyl-[acyl-carrier-protein] synthase II
MTRRVVVTGLGTVNSHSSHLPDLWQALCAGRSGIGLIDLFDTTAFKTKFGGQIKNWEPEQSMDGKTARRLDRFAQFAMVSAINAVKDCGVDFSREDTYRCGVIFASGIGGLSEFEEQHGRYLDGGPHKISPFVIPKMIANSAAGSISIHFGVCGPNTAISTACASAAHALGDAMNAIRWNYADVMIAGGSEAGITPMGLGGFNRAQALSERNDSPQTASRPWDKDRDGFVLSEGAGALILEELEHAKKRNAPIYAELLGVGNTADAYHITAPHPEGTGAAMAMKLALRDAHINPEDVQYVNAHGTSTPLGDIAETKAIKTAFGNHAHKLAISSTKSMVGHLLGASGAVEMIATLLTLQRGVIHPTINYFTPDPDCDLDYVPNKARETRVRRAISNSFGFGGHNCCLVAGAI